MPNRLAQETSPYLLQHAENPVDWFPWGEEAWAKARAEDKPVLVSIGYSACHWCHVMERESFEDPAIAAAMNERFVCIKVDREERPDVDAIYMDALQAMTGQGGWPLNAFATPEQVPFHAGTYFPPVSRQGMPAWTPGARRRGQGVDRAARRDPRRLGADRRAPQRPGAAAGRRPGAARDAARRRRGGDPRALRRRPRRLRRRAEVPAPLDARVPARRGRDRDVAGHAARDGARRDPRPDRRRLRPLHGRRHLDGPPLREDALRQRAARPLLPARVARLRRGGAARDLRGHARLAAARDARARGRLLLRARRRLRGRRGQVLRLDAGADRGRARRPGGRGDALLGRHAGGELRGREHPRPRLGATRPRTSTSCGPRCSPPGPSASGPASTTSG